MRFCGIGIRAISQRVPKLLSIMYDELENYSFEITTISHRNKWVKMRATQMVFSPDQAGSSFNINMSYYHYRESHYGDKTVVRSSNLHNGSSYTAEMASPTLYWISPQNVIYQFFLQNSSFATTFSSFSAQFINSLRPSDAYMHQ